VDNWNGVAHYERLHCKGSNMGARSTEQSKAQILLTTELRIRLILHFQKECQKYMDGYLPLSGSLSNLQHGSLRSKEEALEIEREIADFLELWR